MNQEPIQKLMKQLGETGCYFLSIVRAAELSTGKQIDAVVAYLECARKGWISSDCFVDFPADIYGYLVGGLWEVRKEPKEYMPVTGEIVMLRYEKKNTMITDGHFVLGNTEKHIIYDPMGASKTVLDGRLASLRIISRKA